MRRALPSRSSLVIFVFLLALAAGAACDSDMPTQPSDGAGGGGGTPTTATVSGTVTDAETGTGVGGAAVTVGGQAATTGASGSYTVSGVTPGVVTVTVQRQGYRNVSTSITVAAGPNTRDVSFTPALAAGFAGAWSGSWRNTTFGTMGAVTGSSSVDTVAQTFTLTMDIDGLVFGVMDPPAFTFTGSYDATGTSVTMNVPVFGDLMIAIDENGGISGTATNIPTPGINDLVFSGTVTSTQIDLTYTITFVGGGSATGVVTLTKT